MRKNDAFDTKIVNTRLTKIFIAIFAPDERLPSSANLKSRYIKNDILSISLFVILPCQMGFKSFGYSWHHLGFRDLEGHEKPETWKVVSKRKKPEKEVNNLDPTEDGEAGEKTHSASYQTQLGFYCHLQINSNRLLKKKKSQTCPSSITFSSLSISS